MDGTEIVGPASCMLAPAQFSSQNRLSAEQEKTLRRAIALKGIRMIPFPFSSALAIVSDIDASTRDRYDAYVGALVGEFGLDFGDSTWLSWQYKGRIDRSNALGFFSRYLSVGASEPRKFFNVTRTFNESLAEFHKGNVDHFHSFLARGPRVIMLEHIPQGGDGPVEIDLKEFRAAGQWNCDDLYVLGVCVVAAPGTEIDVRRVSVRDKKENLFDDYEETPYASPPNGRLHKLFVRAGRPDVDMPLPHLNRVARITIELDVPAQAANVERVMLISGYGEILLQRLAFLRERYNVELHLVTEHAGQHFRNPVRMHKVDALLKRHVAGYKGPIEAYNGRLLDEDGNIVFSTDSDEPHSFGRVFPDLSSELEFRFVIPVPAGRSLGWNPLELVTPSATRAGGGIYWARRVMPHIHAGVDVGNGVQTHSRHDTFVSRLTSAIEGAVAEPGLFWPIYTHLGGVALQPGDNRDPEEDLGDDDQSTSSVPSPYFELEPIKALQNSIYNISGDVPSRSRIWFASATVLYDYSLILKSIARHVERPDGDTIVIRSWVDAVLGKRLPRSAAQLYGLTFYVGSAAKAKVVLDGRPIKLLVRNARDETNRASVTIAETDIRYVVFEQLDPLANLPADTVLQGVGWQWIANRQTGSGFGRLRIAETGKGNGGEKRGTGRLTVPLYGWTPTGAQLLTFSIFIDEGVKFGILLRTRSGGAFYVGDKSMSPSAVPNITATYYIHPLYRSAGKWHTITVPFHDLTWATTATPGGPMPNHPLASFTILAAGPYESGLRIGSFAFLRPRTIADRPDSAGKFCLGGVVPSYRPGQTVHARKQHAGEDDQTRSVVVDQRGYFCFGSIPSGIYRVWSSVNGKEVHDRRGGLVEVNSNAMNLVLNRHVAAAGAQPVTRPPGTGSDLTG